MLTKILDSSQDDLLAKERRVPTRLQMALVRVEATQEHQSALARSIEQFDEIFLT